MWKPVLIVGMLVGSQASAQSFSCGVGKQPSCLDYGDKICSSRGKCVSDDAVCFDSYQCGYEGFTCKSNVTELAGLYDNLLRKNNLLVDDFNELLEKGRGMAKTIDNMNSCLQYATSLSDAQSCQTY
jgi:hypothetical protein